MSISTLDKALAGLPLGPLRYFDRIDSTNDEAARWVEAGAPNLALVLADEQTAGRGRLGRQWLTSPGSALAFSLVLRTFPQGGHRGPGFLSPERQSPPKLILRHSALGALAVSQALQDYGLAPEIKWPNYVLLDRRKVCGVLAETIWQGDRLQVVILGIGVNVSPSSVPSAQDLLYPAACIENALPRHVERLELLRSIVAHLLHIRTYMAQPAFISRWQENLAFIGEWVRLTTNASDGSAPSRLGKVLGLDQNGCLQLCSPEGELYTVSEGELSLRPVE
jgi:BirA family biotin operon repressor/biotin-[acetyl-CoA-carboxylase] ligase